MRYEIYVKPLSNRFIVLKVDKYGNRFDTMHSFDSMLKAKNFIKAAKKVIITR